MTSHPGDLGVNSVGNGPMSEISEINTFVHLTFFCPKRLRILYLDKGAVS